MSVSKLLDDLALALEEVKASSADKKGDEGQMVALYGTSPGLSPCDTVLKTDLQEWARLAWDRM
jgi:hypothetical protein